MSELQSGEADATVAQPTKPSLISALKQRLKGPGGLYNLGNIVGFVGGLTAAVAGIPFYDFGLSTVASAAAEFVWGSPSASALTLATIIFFWSGEEYHRAWSNGFPPDEQRVRRGDLSSAVGAVLLAYAFLALGNVVLALTAGAMHATGKLGSAWAAARAARDPDYQFPFRTVCREMVLLSRIPAMAMAIMGLMTKLPPGASPSPHIVSGVLLACSFIWAAADMLLLPQDSMLSPRRLMRRTAAE